MTNIIPLIRESWAYKMLTSNRFLSLYWRIGGQAAALFLVEVQAYLTEFRPYWMGTVLLGLIISEITKAINSNPT
jgi:formate-dependent nitrite reductase membrane component NrfD